MDMTEACFLSQDLENLLMGNLIDIPHQILDTTIHHTNNAFKQETILNSKSIKTSSLNRNPSLLSKFLKLENDSVSQVYIDTIQQQYLQATCNYNLNEIYHYLLAPKSHIAQIIPEIIKFIHQFSILVWWKAIHKLFKVNCRDNNSSVQKKLRQFGFSRTRQKPKIVAGRIYVLFTKLQPPLVQVFKYESKLCNIISYSPQAAYFSKIYETVLKVKFEDYYCINSGYLISIENNMIIEKTKIVVADCENLKLNTLMQVLLFHNQEFI